MNEVSCLAAPAEASIKSWFGGSSTGVFLHYRDPGVVDDLYIFLPHILC